MKLRYLYVAAVLSAALMSGGCASVVPMGAFYTGVKLPVAATEAAGNRKEGTAECMSVLGLVAIGDCSIETAKKNGGISTVSAVDWEVQNIVGFAQYKLHVYGK